MGGRGGSYSRSSFLGPRGKQKTVDEALAGSNPHYREGRGVAAELPKVHLRL